MEIVFFSKKFSSLCFKVLNLFYSGKREEPDIFLETTFSHYRIVFRTKQVETQPGTYRSSHARTLPPSAQTAPILIPFLPCF